jgi:hypothetical protein
MMGALTLTVIKHLGDSAVVIAEDDTMCPDWRMARIGDVALLEKPADDRLPRRIDCYELAEYSASGAAFRLDPARLVYSLRWKHNATHPITRWSWCRPSWSAGFTLRISCYSARCGGGRLPRSIGRG